MDNEIAALALQLEEISSYNGRLKGKHPANKLPDTELATSAFQTEIQAHLSRLKDLKVAHSLNDALRTDVPLLQEIANGELQARRDRDLALRLSGRQPENGDPLPYAEAVRHHVPLVEPENRIHSSSDSITDIRVDGSEIDHQDAEAIAGPSGTQSHDEPETQDEPTADQRVCCVRMGQEPSSGTIDVSCEQVYCSDCLKELFMQATKDQTLMPLRCCRNPISLDLVQSHLSPNELETFVEAKIEFTTPDKTYCSNLDCVRFVRPEQIKAGRARCIRCETSTCAMCKDSYHSDDCREDQIF